MDHPENIEILEMAEGSIEKGWLLDPDSKFKSRIDEQAELICILKKRADTLLNESSQYQKRIESLECTNSDIKMQLNTEKNRVRMLECRFDDLADNHTEMIKFKDFHKTSATDLRAENDLLRQENSSLMSPVLRAKEEEIELWKTRNHDLFQKIEKLTLENRNLNGNNEILEKINLISSKTIEDLTKKCCDLEFDVTEKDDKYRKDISELKTKNKKDVFDLESENQRLLKLSLSRGQEISLKDEKISELETRVTDQLKQISAIEKEWKEAKIKLTKDATVKRLSNENNDMKKSIASKEMEFEAFKDHTTDLINREKQLNKKLRSYSFQASP